MNGCLSNVAGAVLCLYLVSGTASAAPSVSGVSGTLTNGASVVVNGSGFGTHPDYHQNVAGKLAWLWQDFETALEYDGLGSEHPDYWLSESAIPISMFRIGATALRARPGPRPRRSSAATTAHALGFEVNEP